MTDKKKEGHIAVIIIFLILILFMSAINRISQVSAQQIEMVMIQQ